MFFAFFCRPHPTHDPHPLLPIGDPLNPLFCDGPRPGIFRGQTPIPGFIAFVSQYHSIFGLGLGGGVGEVWSAGWHWVSGWRVEGIEVARWRGQGGVEGPNAAGVEGLAAGFVLRGWLEHPLAGHVAEGAMIWGRLGRHGDWASPWRTGKSGLDILWAVYDRDYLERFLAGVNLLPIWFGQWLRGGEEAGGLMNANLPWARAVEDGSAFGRQLANPPVLPMARDLWYRAKVTELLTALLWPSGSLEGQAVASPVTLDARVEKARVWLRAHLDEDLDLPVLAAAVHASPAYLSRLFRKQTGKTLMQERRALRVAKAKALLASGRMNISEAAVEVGYRSLSQFARAFAEETGCSPGEWLRARR